MPSKLFSSISMRSLILENRIVISPMCQYAATNGCPGDWHLMHLGQFAISGAGLLIIEMTNVEARGRISLHCMGLYNQDNETALARVVDFCRQQSNTKIGIQLAHAGRKASTLPPWQGRKPLHQNKGGWQTVSASAIANSGQSPLPTALTEIEIVQIIDAFAAAARRAQRIGIDAIELHGAHGYLLHQFLSPLSNHRKDDYGGSLQNRMRFPLEVFAAVRAAWPDDKPLGMRVSAIDWVEGGLTIEDTIEFGHELARLGCDWIDVSSGGLTADEEITVGPGYQVPFAEQIKKQTGLTVIAIGMITGPHQAEAIIANGQSDLVALARGMLYDPRWTWHAATELGVDIDYPVRYQRCKPLSQE